MALFKHLCTANMFSPWHLFFLKSSAFIFFFTLIDELFCKISKYKRDNNRVSKIYRRFQTRFKYSHTYKHANTYIRKHIRVGQNRSSIKNEFRFPCCCYCCFATVFDFAVTIFYKHSFLFQYPLSHLVFGFYEQFYKKQNCHHLVQFLECLIWCILNFDMCSHVYVHLQAVIEKRKRVSQKVYSKM